MGREKRNTFRCVCKLVFGVHKYRVSMGPIGIASCCTDNLVVFICIKSINTFIA